MSDPIVPGDLGNTKQISPSKKWCFTWNNYPSDFFEKMIQKLDNKDKYIYGKEIGEEGTSHLQGFVYFNKKIRPLSKFKDLGIHWEKAKGTVDENITYCSKDGDFVSKGLDPIELVNPDKDWQKELLIKLQGKPHNREINWYVDYIGGAGKTCLSKYLAVKFGACIVGGKSHDIRHGIMKYKEEHEFWPTIVVFDVARSCNLVSYQAIEEVKNGLFFSGKYEGGQAVFNSPHVIVFSNEDPKEGKLSVDRLSIKKL